MLSPANLGPALTALRTQAVPMTGLGFRSIHLQYFANFTTAQPLFMAAGGVAGTRYVPPGGPQSLYLAIDADTAHREGNQTYFQTASTAAGLVLVKAGALRPDPV